MHRINVTINHNLSFACCHKSLIPWSWECPQLHVGCVINFHKDPLNICDWKSMNEISCHKFRDPFHETSLEKRMRWCWPCLIHTIWFLANVPKVVLYTFIACLKLKLRPFVAEESLSSSISHFNSPLPMNSDWIVQMNCQLFFTWKRNNIALVSSKKSAEWLSGGHWQGKELFDKDCAYLLGKCIRDDKWYLFCPRRDEDVIGKYEGYWSDRKPPFGGIHLRNLLRSERRVNNRPRDTRCSAASV